MSDQAFFAVRVAIRATDTGETATRDYVRGFTKVGKERFTSFAIGDMIQLLEFNTNKRPFTIETFEISATQLFENRKYKHTTHEEG